MYAPSGEMQRDAQLPAERRATSGEYPRKERATDRAGRKRRGSEREQSLRKRGDSRVEWRARSVRYAHRARAH